MATGGLVIKAPVAMALVPHFLELTRRRDSSSSHRLLLVLNLTLIWWLRAFGSHVVRDGRDIAFSANGHRRQVLQRHLLVLLDLAIVIGECVLGRCCSA